MYSIEIDPMIKSYLANDNCAQARVSACVIYEEEKTGQHKNENGIILLMMFKNNGMATQTNVVRFRSTI